ncbi:MAG: aminomethyl-transferring glycine dehydrogenase subunit GcvPA [Chromatiales bacterium]|jgi:glycine dehydrogenase subunit 1
MPFIPHTDDEVREMLDAIGVEQIDDLFDEIPAELRNVDLSGIPEGLTEMEVAGLMHERARQDGHAYAFIGAGAYDHHIPAAVWEIATRGEFYSAYTPYQAEASQGTLQLLYEFQSMMAALTDMDASNASLYDGASALGEAMLMAVRAHRKSKSRKILVPKSLHPAYRATAHSIVKNQQIELIELPYDASGKTDLDALQQYCDEDITALVVPQPNFFGVLEDVDALSQWAQDNNALVIAVVNPLALSILKPPGQWGNGGADICCGEGQPLGIPLSSGGPYFGFMCCKQALVRQMPGRIIGRTVDLDGKPGYSLTLQAREQHIRRSKATSNICTNQGLMVTAATIHMAMLGAEGLARAAGSSHAKHRQLIERLTAIDGVEPVFNSPVYNETVLRLPIEASEILRALAVDNVLAGYDMSEHYPELGHCLLVCSTEKQTDTAVDVFVDRLQSVISARANPDRPAKPKLNV